MEERLDQQTKDNSEYVVQSNLPNSFQNQYVSQGSGCSSYKSNFRRSGYGRGYQGSSNHNNYNSNSNYNNAHQNNYSQRGNIGSGFVCLFDLILYVPSAIFQLNRNGSSCVEPLLS